MGKYTIFQMFESPRRGRQARNFTKCSENCRSQIVFRTDIFRKLTLGAPEVFVYVLLLFSLGTYNGPKRNSKQCLCKILEGQTKSITVWCFLFWSVLSFSLTNCLLNTYGLLRSLASEKNNHYATLVINLMPIPIGQSRDKKGRTRNAVPLAPGYRTPFLSHPLCFQSYLF